MVVVAAVIVDFEEDHEALAEVAAEAAGEEDAEVVIAVVVIAVVVIAVVVVVVDLVAEEIVPVITVTKRAILQENALREIAVTVKKRAQ